jgi:hypothetical protein
MQLRDDITLFSERANNTVALQRLEPFMFQLGQSRERSLGPALQVRFTPQKADIAVMYAVGVTVRIGDN